MLTTPPEIGTIAGVVRVRSRVAKRSNTINQQAGSRPHRPPILRQSVAIDRSIGGNEWPEALKTATSGPLRPQECGLKKKADVH